MEDEVISSVSYAFHLFFAMTLMVAYHGRDYVTEEYASCLAQALSHRAIEVKACSRVWCVCELTQPVPWPSVCILDLNRYQLNIWI